jgi:hypothetical protein
MCPESSTLVGSGVQGGHSSSLDEKRQHVFRQLQLELLFTKGFQDILEKIGPSPEVDLGNSGKRWRRRKVGGELFVIHETRTKRAARLWAVATALHGALSTAEIDYYAQIFQSRRASGLWCRDVTANTISISMPGSLLPAGEPRSDRVPRASTIRFAAESLAVRAMRALGGEPNDPRDLTEADRNRLSQVFGFLGLPLAESRPSIKREAAARRRRRDAPRRRKHVELERAGLDRRVAAGELRRLGEFIYVSV